MTSTKYKTCLTPRFVLEFAVIRRAILECSGHASMGVPSVFLRIQAAAIPLPAFSSVLRHGSTLLYSGSTCPYYGSTLLYNGSMGVHFLTMALHVLMMGLHFLTTGLHFVLMGPTSPSQHV